MRKFNGRMVGRSRKKVFVRESREDTDDSAAQEEIVRKGGKGKRRRRRSKKGRKPKAAGLWEPRDGVLVDSREMDPTITPDPRRRSRKSSRVRPLSEMSFGIRSNPNRLSSERAAPNGLRKSKWPLHEDGITVVPKSLFHNYVRCGSDDGGKKVRYIPLRGGEIFASVRLRSSPLSQRVSR